MHGKGIFINNEGIKYPIIMENGKEVK